MNYTRQTPGIVEAAVVATMQRLGRATCADIERWGNLVTGSARAPLKRLHDTGKTHIVDWSRKPNGTMYAAVWTWGPGADVARPPRKHRPKTPKGSPFRDDMGWRTEGLPMDYPVKSVFVGGKNPWTGA